MSKRKFLIFMSLVLAVVVLSWGIDQGWAQSPNSNKELKFKGGKVTADDVAKSRGKVAPSEQKAAAKRARQLGLYPGVAGFATQAPQPSGTR